MSIRVINKSLAGVAAISFALLLAGCGGGEATADEAVTASADKSEVSDGNGPDRGNGNDLSSNDGQRDGANSTTDDTASNGDDNASAGDDSTTGSGAGGTTDDTASNDDTTGDTASNDDTTGDSGREPSDDTADNNDQDVDRTATLSWTAPGTRVNGEKIQLAELQEYEIVYGQDPDALEQSVTVVADGSMSHTIEDLTDGDWYFAVRVIDQNGLSSDLSSVVSKTI
ncbi:hypothetical protein C8D92_11128 [Tamilnaduibacter salinus]|uniref:Fibronectin type-III domain-containing protein n=1 Tax=Tamilnaduibacter salinus TaxID=1484056 RepID=A0A2A2I286_9GAMM|nr:fibronectin type III domain-containing protein [Tamilnaduibacter salinus]PAV25839.1 hypothetical protein CF392_08880 [Tamilnaduibacter salinus]PVY69800.1 hypothetical protein C8D92_11128 [Tamilnaduibacter salinus]